MNVNALSVHLLKNLMFGCFLFWKKCLCLKMEQYLTCPLEIWFFNGRWVQCLCLRIETCSDAVWWCYKHPVKHRYNLWLWKLLTCCFFCKLEEIVQAVVIALLQKLLETRSFYLQCSYIFLILADLYFSGNCWLISLNKSANVKISMSPCYKI